MCGEFHKKGVTKKAKAKKASNQNDDLYVIRQKMRVGDIAAIARATGYDQSHVSRVLKGDSKNPSGDIVKYAKKMVSKRKK